MSGNNLSRILTPVSRWSATILAVLALIFLLPAIFDKVGGSGGDEPLLFFSPLLEEFIYQESLGGHQFLYRDEQGRDYSRQDFEDQLPFVYFRNLERRNLLPMAIAGRTFDTEAIAADRQGLEIRARHLRGHHPRIDLYPLFNIDPAVAMMRFPVEMFRFTDSAMEFLNADYNRLDRDLTETFTNTLRELGFSFPATVIGGRATNLKPFDDGYFIRDAVGRIFHVKRVLNRPEVVATDIDPSLDVLDIIVNENERREFHGVIITRQGEAFLISWDDYRLIPLPVQGYDPARMDLKLLIDPLYRTVTVSSDKSVFGVAMNTAYEPVRRFELSRRDASSPWVQRMREFLFPVELHLESPWRGQADLQVQLGGPWSIGGILTALAVLLLIRRGRDKTLPVLADLAPVALTGFIGLLAVLFLQPGRRRAS
ncbi:DUF4857 domain-containing protein [Desulfonatronum sp. SC1]|uniref:DUF4857 domain-containing protein n=1 Tax=Desulfonatronum sp. SC1 TaxID=2109626 RepID=UPI000D31FA89|nr:DUF4857 domain-containing protein [Desulfonatronum sp. SC1]PTN38757.1 hypothetical protein C6366_02145 [Desulfonatronum sp. SC1]